LNNSVHHLSSPLCSRSSIKNSPTPLLTVFRVVSLQESTNTVKFGGGYETGDYEIESVTSSISHAISAHIDWYTPHCMLIHAEVQFA
jgi:hypothetical protein